MDLADLPANPFDGRADFQRALVLAMAQARQQMLWFDLDLSDWPIEQPAVAALVARFCRSSRQARLRVLVRDDTWLARHSARFAALRRRAGDVIECRKLPEQLVRVDEGVLLVDDCHMVKRFHADHFHGRLALDVPGEVQGLAPRYDALWDLGVPCAPATTLGL